MMPRPRPPPVQPHIPTICESMVTVDRPGCDGDLTVTVGLPVATVVLTGLMSPGPVAGLWQLVTRDSPSPDRPRAGPFGLGASCHESYSLWARAKLEECWIVSILPVTERGPKDRVTREERCSFQGSGGSLTRNGHWPARPSATGRSRPPGYSRPFYVGLAECSETPFTLRHTANFMCQMRTVPQR